MGVIMLVITFFLLGGLMSPEERKAWLSEHGYSESQIEAIMEIEKISVADADDDE